MAFFEVQHWTKAVVRYSMMGLLGFGAGAVFGTRYLNKETNGSPEMSVVYKIEDDGFVPYIVESQHIAQRFKKEALLEFNSEKKKQLEEMLKRM